MKTEEGNRSRVQKQQLEILITTFHPGKDIRVDMTPTKWQKSSPVRKMNKDIWQAGLGCKKVWGKSQLIVFVWVCEQSSCEIWIGHIPQCTIANLIPKESLWTIGLDRPDGITSYISKFQDDTMSLEVAEIWFSKLVLKAIK